MALQKNSGRVRKCPTNTRGTQTSNFKSSLPINDSLLIWCEWNLDDGTFIPVMTTIAPAPDAIIHLIKCEYKTNRCQQCKCHANNLYCTDRCDCDTVQCEHCVDVELEYAGDDENDDAEDEP